LITKKDLQSAVKYGTREYSTNQRGETNLKFKYEDIIYITDLTCTKEITCWVQPGAGLDIQKKKIDTLIVNKHTNSLRMLADHSNWTSHTVFVVDQSGSMRKTDIEGGCTRSDAVWLTMALDYVSKQLDEKDRDARKARDLDVV
jgi:hypothetical protein